MEAIINYKPKSTYLMLALGVLFVIVGFFGSKENSVLSSFFGFGIFYIGMALYNFKYQFARITETYIKRSGIFYKKLEIENIKCAKKFAGDYIFKTADRELNIDTRHIAPNSICELEKFYQLIILKLGDNNHCS